jgi:hypothetical protein
MRGSPLAGLLLGSALLTTAGIAAAEGKLGFFESDELSFEHPGQPAPAEAAAAAPESRPAPPVRAPPPPATRVPPTVRPAPTSTGGLRAPPPPGISLGPAPAPVAPDEALPAQTVGGVVTRPAATDGATSLGAGLRFEVVRVRKLTADERRGTKGKLRCKDPLAAEIRPDRPARFLLASLMNVAERNLPEVVSWVFSRDGACFDRGSDPRAKALDALDEAARRAAPGGM